MKIRRLCRAVLAAAMLAIAAGAAWAAPPTVEIVAMAHPPVRFALKPLREWLAQQGGKLRVIEIDAESPQGEKRLASVGLEGHIPIVILIDGKHAFRRQDGSRVEFVNFPAVKESPPGIRGAWVTADVETALMGRMK